MNNAQFTAEPCSVAQCSAARGAIAGRTARPPIAGQLSHCVGASFLRVQKALEPLDSFRSGIEHRAEYAQASGGVQVGNQETDVPQVAKLGPAVLPQSLIVKGPFQRLKTAPQLNQSRVERDLRGRQPGHAAGFYNIDTFRNAGDTGSMRYRAVGPVVVRGQLAVAQACGTRPASGSLGRTSQQPPVLADHHLEFTPLFRGKVPQVAPDRFDDQSPLRLPSQPAEQEELVAHLGGKSDAQLRIVRDAGACVPGGRSPKALLPDAFRLRRG